MLPGAAFSTHPWARPDIGRELVTLLPRLRRFALSLTGSRHFADDLVQGTCERALAAAGSWTPGTRLDAWMFRILRNLWIDTHRRRRTEQLVSGAVGEHGVCTDGEREIEARLMLKRVRRAIAGLPPESREVLILVCVKDMSYRAAAARLGVPIGTVMSRLSRARMRLAEITGVEWSHTDRTQEGLVLGDADR